MPKQFDVIYLPMLEMKEARWLCATPTCEFDLTFLDNFHIYVRLVWTELTTEIVTIRGLYGDSTSVSPREHNMIVGL